MSSQVQEFWHSQLNGISRIVGFYYRVTFEELGSNVCGGGFESIRSFEPVCKPYRKALGLRDKILLCSCTCGILFQHFCVQQNLGRILMRVQLERIYT